MTSRRNFLRGDLSGTARPRPPGAVNEMAFHELCTRCGDCVAVCPENIITIDKAGYPVLDFDLGGCQFCNECSTACDARALQPINSDPGTAGNNAREIVWDWRAHVAPTCLSQSGVHCRACQDFCDARAIRFQLLPGGRARMDLDPDTCTGCGSCIAPCPVNAITLTKREQPMEASQC